MSEPEVLKEWAGEAPDPGPRFTEDVLAAGRRRLRRRWAISGGCAALTAAAIALPLLALGSGAGGRDAALNPAPAGQRPVPSVSHLAVAAGIYAAVLRLPRLFGASPPPAGPGVRRVIVRSSTCANVQSAGVGACDPRPIPRAVQREVLAELPTRPRVSFVARSAENKSSSAAPHPAVVFVTFGRIGLAGQHARLFVQVYCGFDCLRGEDLVLTERSGAWIVSGSVGAYMS